MKRHTVQVQEGRPRERRFAFSYRAVCTCRWFSGWYGTEAEAREPGGVHAHEHAGIELAVVKR